MYGIGNSFDNHTTRMWDAQQWLIVSVLINDRQIVAGVIELQDVQW